MFLITITFGMPDFITTSAGSDNYIAVQIDDEILTKRQVAETRSRFFRENYQGKELPQGFRDHLENQIVDQMIEREIFLMMLRDMGLYPIGRSKNHIMFPFLKENFSNYFSDTLADIEKFKKEFLQPNRISYQNFEEDVVSSSAHRDIYSLLESINFEDNPERILFWEMEQNKLSYQIGVIDKAKKEKILRSEIVVTEKEIQEGFQKDYVSKDPNAKLTPVKRQALQTKLSEQKMKEFEKQWLNDLKKLIKAKSLYAAGKKHNVKIFTLPDVSLTDKFDQKKPSGVPYLGDLEKSDSFHAFIVSSGLNEPNVIIEKDNIFLVNIIEREIGFNSDHDKIFTQEDAFLQFIEKNKEDQKSSKNKVSKSKHTDLLKGIIDYQKKNVRIKRNI